MYGLVVGGIKGARIWFGPLLSEICYVQVWATNVIVWYSVLTIFFMSFFKFLYICVWKHMRDMNDNLIVTFIIRLSIFVSVWVPTTGFLSRKGSSGEGFCTGIFNNYDQIMDPQISPEELPQPYAPLLWLVWIAILFFMVSVKIRPRRISLDSVDDDSVTIGVQRPRDLDSILLNFTIMILLLINLLDYHLFWKK